MSISKILPSTLFFGFFIVAYASVFLINPQLGPDNDYPFLRTLQVGKPLLEFSKDFVYSDVIGDLGRWLPMVNMEYNFIGLFSKSPSPFWYYLFHAIQFVAFAFLFAKLLEKASVNKTLAYITIVVLVLLPGFTQTWFRLQFPERNIIFLFAVFLLSYFALSKNGKAIYFFLALLSANLAIYYKEIPFIALSTFALFHLIFSRRNRENKPKMEMLNVLVILSSVIFLALYYFIAYRNSDLGYLPSVFSIVSRIKTFANYAFFSDSVLVLVLIPFTILRFWKIFVKKTAPEPMYDSMLLGASAYVASFFVLNLYGPYYLLPAYGLGLPALLYFFGRYPLKSLPFFKIVLAIAVFCLAFNAIPQGLYYLTFNKYFVPNFNKMADFLVKDINRRSESNPNDRPSIFFYGLGVNSGGIQGVHFILYENLIFRGLDEKKYDMKSEVTVTTDYSSFSKIKPSLTVFSPSPAITIKPGDYLLVTPKSVELINNDLIEKLRRDYNLVFETKSPLALPNINLKTLAKYYLSRKLLAGKQDRKIIDNNNLFPTPDHYVFVKK